MTALVISEHDNSELKGATLNTVSAAQKLDDEIHLLVAGSNCNSVAESASTIDGVSKVLYVDSPEYENFLAEKCSSFLRNCIFIFVVTNCNSLIIYETRF